MADIGILFGGKRAGKIGELQLNATLSELHEYTNEVSEFPIEDGADINDHVKMIPEEIVIDGFITNTPVNVLQNNSAQVVNVKNNTVEIKNLSRSLVGNNVDLALDILLKISGRTINGEPAEPEEVTITTGLRVYTGMLMTSLSIPRNIRTGKAMNFTARFKKSNRVMTETVFIPNPKPEVANKASSTVDKGKQNPKVSEDIKKDKASTASFLFKGFTKLDEIASFN